MIARPGIVQFANALPKTRSGKIVRCFLRQIAADQDIVGDKSTVVDPNVLDKLREKV